MEETLPYRFEISLRFRHPKMELSGCSSEFGLMPMRQWTVGQERSTPHGKPLEGLWDESYWIASLEIESDEVIETALMRIAQWLSRHASFLSAHSNSGGSAALFIGLFLEGFSCGFSLEPSLLARYTPLGVALEFDVYGPPDVPDAP